MVSRFCRSVLLLLNAAALLSAPAVVFAQSGRDCRSLPLNNLASVSSAVWADGKVLVVEPRSDDPGRAPADIRVHAFGRVGKGVPVKAITPKNLFSLSRDQKGDGFIGQVALPGAGFCVIQALDSDLQPSGKPVDICDDNLVSVWTSTVANGTSTNSHVAGHVVGFGVVDGPDGYPAFFARRLAADRKDVLTILQLAPPPGGGYFYRYYTLHTLGVRLMTSIGPVAYYINLLDGYPRLSSYDTDRGVSQDLSGFPLENIKLVEHTGGFEKAFMRLAQSRDMPVALIAHEGFLYSLHREVGGAGTKNASWQLIKMAIHGTYVEVEGEAVRIPSSRPLLTAIPSPGFWYFIETGLPGSDLAQQVYGMLEVPSTWFQQIEESPLLADSSICR